jgi:hypothetical protein
MKKSAIKYSESIPEKIFGFELNDAFIIFSFRFLAFQSSFE